MKHQSKEISESVKGLCQAVLTLIVSHAISALAEPGVSGDSVRSAQIQQSPINVYKYTNRQGAVSFSDRAPVNQNYRVITINLGCYACNVESRVDWHDTPLHLAAYRGTIDDAASRYRVDPALVRAVIHAESAFKPDARSRAGAMGLMQLMPGTAKDMGVVDPLSPDQNIAGGVRYLAWLMSRTGGNITLATAAYNAGPGAVERHGGVPPYKETQTYVKRVRILHDRYRKALASPS